MRKISLAEFASDVTEIMPVIIHQFMKSQISEFYKVKLTLPQFIVLDILNGHGESKMTDLARFMNVTTAAMTGLIERLVRDGYAARISDPRDRRVVKIKLTAKGSSIVKNMIEKRKRMTMKIFGMISQKEREEYLKILMHIRDHLKK